jgi:hypothetical protein
MLQARYGFTTLVLAAAILASSAAQAFCFSSGGNNSRHSPYTYYAPPAPPAWQVLYGSGGYPVMQPAVAYTPVYVSPQPPAYGLSVPVQPMQQY